MRPHGLRAEPTSARPIGTHRARTRETKRKKTKDESSDLKPEPQPDGENPDPESDHGSESSADNAAAWGAGIYVSNTAAQSSIFIDIISLAFSR